MIKSNFSFRVLKIVSKIPKGKVMTYKSIADKLNSKAYRAIGNILRNNPNPIKIPCHRVICSDFKVGGYLGELNSKRKISILRKEGIKIKKDKVIDVEKVLYIAQ